MHRQWMVLPSEPKILMERNRPSPINILLDDGVWIEKLTGNKGRYVDTGDPSPDGRMQSSLSKVLKSLM